MDQSRRPQRACRLGAEAPTREQPAETPKALTFVPATVIDIEPVARGVVIRLPRGVVIELAGASPTWVAALARELSRSS